MFLPESSSRRAHHRQLAVYLLVHNGRCSPRTEPKEGGSGSETMGSRRHTPGLELVHGRHLARIRIRSTLRPLGAQQKELCSPPGLTGLVAAPPSSDLDPPLPLRTLLLWRRESERMRPLSSLQPTHLQLDREVRRWRHRQLDHLVISVARTAPPLPGPDGEENRGAQERSWLAL